MPASHSSSLVQGLLAGKYWMPTPIPSESGSATKASSADVIACHFVMPLAVAAYMDSERSSMMYTSSGRSSAACSSPAQLCSPPAPASPPRPSLSIAPVPVVRLTPPVVGPAPNVGPPVVLLEPVTPPEPETLVVSVRVSPFGSSFLQENGIAAKTV